MTTESVVVSGGGKQLDFVLPGVVGDRGLDRPDMDKLGVYLKWLRLLPFHAGRESQGTAAMNRRWRCIPVKTRKQGWAFANCVQGIWKGQVKQGDVN